MSPPYAKPRKENKLIEVNEYELNLGEELYSLLILKNLAIMKLLSF